MLHNWDIKELYQKRAAEHQQMPIFNVFQSLAAAPIGKSGNVYRI